VIQSHLDQTFENDNRKRRLRRRQLSAYLTILAVVLLVIVWLEQSDRGLLLADGAAGSDGWWVVSAVAYGTLGGAFSAAHRVATAPPTGGYPEMRWAQLATAFRPLAGGAGALVAFAALEVGLLGDDVDPARLALAAFVAGFSERYVASLAKDS
jgi:hypothetical protein